MAVGLASALALPQQGSRGGRSLEAPQPAVLVALHPASTGTAASAAAHRLEPPGERDPAMRESEPAAATPMSEAEAITHLSRAWQARFESPPSHVTLSLLWAHWAHETARGRRMRGFNFAGLKGRGPDGDRAVMWTREGEGPERPLVLGTFRTYRSAEQGARDYLDLLAARFPTALRAARAGDVTRFVGALSRGGYFTDNPAVYRRAVSRLTSECRRRGLPPGSAVEPVRSNPP